jgi:NodT family efflux transporter outer membrane factor (OMF) lipoprotein
MSYEIDLFGKLAAQREASDLDVQAQRADLETLAITVAAQVSEAWLDVIFQHRRVLLVTEQIATAEKYLELTMLRLSQGLATALDVNQQRADIHGLEARREQATVAEEVARLRLKALLGSAGESATVDVDQSPNLGPRLQAGTPATVIEQRPDVRAAMIRLQAADARTAQAARDRLPTLRLSANLFLQAAEIGNLFDDLFWSIGAQVVQPIFEGGRRQARVDQQVAAARERLYVYAKSVIQAIQEVESSMIQEVAQERLRDLLQQQKEVAEVSLELARDRYRSGALDYLRVLTALRSLQTAEQSLLDAERQQFSFRIQTCRALGGGWTQSLQAPQENQ